MCASYSRGQLLRLLSLLRLMSFLPLIACLLSACGGGGGSSSTPFLPKSSARTSSVANSSSLSSMGNSSSANSSIFNAVTISGKVTYDFVPLSGDGLNYGATEVRAVRGAVVELLSGADTVLSSTITNEEGFYSLAAAQNTAVRVRTKAQLKRTEGPGWLMSVTDNTNNNNIYALDGSLANSGSGNSQRNLHASSGWGGSAYTSARAAAPFAILDSVYVGLQRFLEAGHLINFRPLEFRWSVNNNTAANPDDDFTTGEIGTSFFWGDAIYILGEVNSDTDEYDRHVILHEWGHYIEAALSRADTIGGAHIDGDRLDMRVAFSEGFGNAFSAMMLDDPLYRDSNSFGQTSVFSIDVSETANLNKGWYSEASVHSVLYNYYVSDNNKTALDFAPVLTVLTDDQYIKSNYLTSIFLFAERLLTLFPDHKNIFESLLEQQDINSTAADATLESNDANYLNALPVYKSISVDGPVVNICSTSRFGKYNKLGVSQFLQMDISSGGLYAITVSRSGGANVPTDPDFSLYFGGEEIIYADDDQTNFEEENVNLSPGKHILEVYDWNNRNQDSTANNNPTCFNVQVSF